MSPETASPGTRKLFYLAIALLMVFIAIGLGSIFSVQGPPVTTTVTGFSSTSTGPVYQVFVQVDKAAYTTGESILVSGTVSPPPQAASNVAITVEGPEGVVAAGSIPVNATGGAYAYSLATGGLSSGWVAGTYTVTAEWAGFGQSANASTTFVFSVPPA